VQYPLFLREAVFPSTLTPPHLRGLFLGCRPAAPGIAMTERTRNIVAAVGIPILIVIHWWLWSWADCGSFWLQAC